MSSLALIILLEFNLLYHKIYIIINFTVSHFGTVQLTRENFYEPFFFSLNIVRKQNLIGLKDALLLLLEHYSD